MAFYQCSFCENSFRSDEERKKHEEVCVKNGKTEQERFETRKHQAKETELRKDLKEPDVKRRYEVRIDVEKSYSKIAILNDIEGF